MESTLFSHTDSTLSNRKIAELKAKFSLSFATLKMVRGEKNSPLVPEFEFLQGKHFVVREFNV